MGVGHYRPRVLKWRTHAVHMDRLIAFEQPYLTRKSERQLLMYSMDKRVALYF